MTIRLDWIKTITHHCHYNAITFDPWLRQWSILESRENPNVAHLHAASACGCTTTAGSFAQAMKYSPENPSVGHVHASKRDCTTRLRLHDGCGRRTWRPWRGCAHRSGRPLIEIARSATRCWPRTRAHWRCGIARRRAHNAASKQVEVKRILTIPYLLHVRQIVLISTC